MGRIKTVTLSRHTAPPFLMASGLEAIQLRKVRWISRCLFWELLALADHATGRISTSYAVLQALLDFDTDPCARDEPGPTLQRVRTALNDLVQLGLVRVDRIANEKRKGLFLRIAPRTGITAPGASSNRQSNRPSRAKNPEESSTCAKTSADDQQIEQQGVQDSIPPPTPSVSTRQAEARLKLRQIAEGIAARGESRAPKGA